MIELIDRSKLEPDTEWNDYDDDYVSYSAGQIKSAPTVNAVPLDKVKQAREEIRKLDDINPDYPMDRTIHVSRNEVLAIIDKLIAESEGNNEKRNNS